MKRLKNKLNKNHIDINSFIKELTKYPEFNNIANYLKIKYGRIYPNYTILYSELTSLLKYLNKKIYYDKLFTNMLFIVNNTVPDEYISSKYPDLIEYTFEEVKEPYKDKQIKIRNENKIAIENVFYNNTNYYRFSNSLIKTSGGGEFKINEYFVKVRNLINYILSNYFNNDFKKLNEQYYLKFNILKFFYINKDSLFIKKKNFCNINKENCFIKKKNGEESKLYF
jgi:hypothetical protein